MVEITHKLRFTNIPEDTEFTDAHGWDVNLDTGATHLVDPLQPEVYAQNIAHMTPPELLFVLATMAEDMTVEEV
jgi:hypothetical protein